MTEKQLQSDALRERPRVRQMITKAEESLGLIFADFVEFMDSEFTDFFIKETVPCTTYVVSFWCLEQQMYIQGSITLFNGKFSISSANFCSGWLVFEDSKFAEIRYLRYAEVATVFNGAYSREDLAKTP